MQIIYLLLLFVSISTYGYTKSPPMNAKTYNMDVSIPVDDRNWQLVDLPLPYNPENAVWLVPEGKNSPSNEMLKVQRFPLGSRMKDITIRSNIPRGSKIYEKTASKNESNTVVYQDSQSKNFTIDHFFQGADGVYMLHYVVPSQDLTEENKQEWVNRIKAATTDLANDPNAIQITSKGVFRNEKEVVFSPTFKTYTHPQYGFSLEIPSSWILQEEINPKRQALGNPFCCLMGGRTDTQSGFSISVSEHEIFTKETGEEFWPDITAEISRSNKIVETGNITNRSGQTGKYFVLRPKESLDGRIWKVIYIDQGKRYVIDFFAQKENFPLLRDTFYKTSTSFSF